MGAFATVLDARDRSLLDEATGCSATCWERRRVKRLWREAIEERRRSEVRREVLERVASLEASLLRDGILHEAHVWDGE